MCLAAAVAGVTRDNGILHIPSEDHLAHCPSSCGDITIFYPFGIEPGCFRQGFELRCDNTAQPPTLFLGNTSTVVTNILYSDTKVRIRTIGFNITINQSLIEHSISWEFPIKDFTIANDSNLFVVGCDLKLDLFDLGANKLMGSCRTLCFNDTKIMENEADGSTCNGMGCCIRPSPKVNCGAFG
ncbi:hypothetical protein ABZP36_032097 [Zizania latifolia]